jgi:hypothetical protein
MRARVILRHLLEGSFEEHILVGGAAAVGVVLV